MAVTSFYPVLMSQNVEAAAQFYREVLGCTTTFDAGWYISLRLGDFELALLAHDHPTVPEQHRALPPGMLINMEVDDVDEMYAHITADGQVTVVQSLRNEDFGQRHFILMGPDDVLIDVIQPIPPTAEFAQAYSSAAESQS